MFDKELGDMYPANWVPKLSYPQGEPVLNGPPHMCPGEDHTGAEKNIKMVMPEDIKDDELKSSSRQGILLGGQWGLINC